MAREICMPKFGQTMTEGTIVGWEKRIGDHVAKGEVLLKIESDKATLDVESEQEGYLLAIGAQPGDVVPCGQTIAWMGDRGEKAPAG
jgi:pyruvate/2-oxoglutarate dehydrogenase complex dihydrolipoamide acyltransferase (E2) component